MASSTGWPRGGSTLDNTVAYLDAYPGRRKNETSSLDYPTRATTARRFYAPDKRGVLRSTHQDGKHASEKIETHDETHDETHETGGKGVTPLHAGLGTGAASTCPWTDQAPKAYAGSRAFPTPE